MTLCLGRPRGGVALDLLRDEQSLPQGPGGQRFHLGDELGVLGRGAEVAFGGAVGFAELDLHVDQGLQGAVAEKDGFQHVIFADHAGSRPRPSRPRSWTRPR